MFSRLFGKEPPKGDRGELLPEPNDGPPDSDRPSGLCPRCGKQSSFEVIGSLPISFSGSYMEGPGGNRTPDALDQVSALLCRHCRQGVAVIEEKYVGETPARQGYRSGGVLSFRGIHWWPLPATRLSSDIPEAIASAFSEAATALAANCPRAAIVMARRTLEAVTDEKGEKIGVLAHRLEALSSKGILLPTLLEWAKEIRVLGNVGAHYDPLTPVTLEDAQQLITFLRELLKHLYELPAELARRRSKP